MPSFDVVSEVDMQEVTNAVDQASREITNRFDFKGTDSTIELHDNNITLHTSSEDRLKALTQVLQERFAKRKVSQKSLDFAKSDSEAKARVRQEVTLTVGINADKAREIGKFIKGLGLKGVQHQVQGQQLRVTSKKRDVLQEIIAALKAEDFGIPLQYENFRD